MEVVARSARLEDLERLQALYGDLAVEQGALRPLWPLAEGLPEPVGEAFAAILAGEDPLLFVGTIDGAVVGFLWVTIVTLLPQARDRRLGVVRLVYTEPEARGVGVGEAMLGLALDALRNRGVTACDARVSPGHRAAKNFFEAHGFAARLIVMHRSEGRT